MVNTDGALLVQTSGAGNIFIRMYLSIKFRSNDNPILVRTNLFLNCSSWSHPQVLGSSLWTKRNVLVQVCDRLSPMAKSPKSAFAGQRYTAGVNIEDEFSTRSRQSGKNFNDARPVGSTIFWTGSRKELESSALFSYWPKPPVAPTPPTRRRQDLVISVAPSVNLQPSRSTESWYPVKTFAMCWIMGNGDPDAELQWQLYQ